MKLYSTLAELAEPGGDFGFVGLVWGGVSLALSLSAVFLSKRKKDTAGGRANYQIL